MCCPISTYCWLKARRYLKVTYIQVTVTNPCSSCMQTYFRCTCRQCTPVTGGMEVHCCHQNDLHWNSVHSDRQFLAHNTAVLCVTQHPAFTKTYLCVENLQNHFRHLKKQQTSGKFKSPYRYLSSSHQF